MFDYSKDILYLVIAFCVLWATAFFCWTLFYVVRILKNASEIMEELRSRLEKLTEAIDYIRSKVEQMSGLLSVVTGGVGGLVQKVVRRKAKEWVNETSAKFDNTAKEAVDKAVIATADKMHRLSKRIKK